MGGVCPAVQSIGVSSQRISLKTEGDVNSTNSTQGVREMFIAASVGQLGITGRLFTSNSGVRIKLAIVKEMDHHHGWVYKVIATTRHYGHLEIHSSLLVHFCMIAASRPIPA